MTKLKGVVNSVPPRRVKQDAYVIKLNCPAPKESLIDYAHMEFAVNDSQRLIQELEAMGFTPDVAAAGKQDTFYFDVGDAYFKIRTTAARLELQLLTVGRHQVEKETETVTLRVLRTLEPLLADAAEQFAEYALGKNLDGRRLR
jgi:hypothetical protein